MDAKQRFDLITLKDKLGQEIEHRLGPPALTLANSTELIYLCPLHSENTPSFHVYTLARDGHEPHYMCYGCGAHGDVIKFVQLFDRVDFIEACKRLGAETHNPDAAAAYKQRMAEQRAETRARREKNREQFLAAHVWETYYRQHNQSLEDLWIQHGIPPKYQDFWQLGYTPDKTYAYQDGFNHAPALTIPFWAFTNGRTGYVQHLQYRLLGDLPPGAGKYRFEDGMGTAAFVADYRQHPGDGEDLLIVEGGKKAMVMWLGLGQSMQVIGLPSMLDDGDSLPDLRQFKRRYVWLDPEAQVRPKQASAGWVPADVALSRALGQEGTRLIRETLKPDDWCLKWQPTPNQLRQVLSVSSIRCP